MDRAARAYRWGLALIAASVLGISAAYSYRDITADRIATEEANAQLTGALAASIEADFDADLRDAANAALSAALLVEQAGGAGAFAGERALHDELFRELTDERSTARLVLTAPDGRVLASSAEYPVPPLTIRPPARSWEAARPAGRSFRIGPPERSVFDGALVVPYWCELVTPGGQSAGTLRAEIRYAHFTEFSRATGGLKDATVLVLAQDGTVLVQLPLVQGHLGARAEPLQRVIAASPSVAGRVELAAWRDDVARFYSWRKVSGLPLAVAVGLTDDAVLGSWRQRSRHRLVFAILASTGLMLLIAALNVYVGHLGASRRQLREIESRYWVALERSTVGIAILDARGQLLHANPALCELIGYSEAELLAMPIELLTVEGDRAVRDAVLSEIAQGRLDTFEREKMATRKDGRVIWVHAQTTVVRDEQRQPANIIVHVKDVTERKNAEQALRELNEDLERRVAERTAELSLANKDLEAFSYSAAHDLRAPLGRLTMFVDVLGSELGEMRPRVARRLDAIQRQVREMTALIDSLLQLARTSRAALNPEAVDLAALTASVIADVQSDAQGRAIAWQTGTLHAVRADRALLRQALANLLGNAVKYTRGRDPAVIEVSSERMEGRPEVVIRIADNGSGFDMDYSADLFVAFRRLHTVSEFEGTGIGLAIVERIVHRSGGRIWAHGEPDRGATFYFTLPAG